MKSFKVKILEADGPFYEGELESLIVPVTDGMIGIQAGHSNLFSALVPGVMTYRIPGQDALIAAISRGCMKVENGEVLILAESIERPEEIDEERARREADAAREAALQKRSIQEFHMAELEMAKATNRLKIKRNSMR